MVQADLRNKNSCPMMSGQDVVMRRETLIDVQTWTPPPKT
jgi:hypothetical protein